MKGRYLSLASKRDPWSAVGGIVFMAACVSAQPWCWFFFLLFAVLVFTTGKPPGEK